MKGIYVYEGNNKGRLFSLLSPSTFNLPPPQMVINEQSISPMALFYIDGFVSVPYFHKSHISMRTLEVSTLRTTYLREMAKGLVARKPSGERVRRKDTLLVLYSSPS